jgi:hypothetical protein
VERNFLNGCRHNGHPDSYIPYVHQQQSHGIGKKNSPRHSDNKSACHVLIPLAVCPIVMRMCLLCFWHCQTRNGAAHVLAWSVRLRCFARCAVRLAAAMALIASVNAGAGRSCSAQGRADLCGSILLLTAVAVTRTTNRCGRSWSLWACEGLKSFDRPGGALHLASVRALAF